MPHTTFLNLPEGKRERIIKAALEEFAHKGYRRGSIHRISFKAGVSKGSMYQYFTNKKDLFLYIFRITLEEKVRLVKKIAEESKNLPFFEQMDRIFSESQRYAREHPLTYLLYLKAKGEVPAEVRDTLDDYLESAGPGRHYALLVQEALSRGEIRGDVDEEFAVFVVHTLMLALPPESSPKQNQFIEFLKNGLAPRDRGTGSLSHFQNTY